MVGNLLENALRYTPEGGAVQPEPLARTTGTPRSRSPTAGPGIEAEDLPHIFERLYVTQRYRPVRPEGSGLGLSIVKELVDADGGATAVDSTPGKGTTLTVRLPMVAAARGAGYLASIAGRPYDGPMLDQIVASVEARLGHGHRRSG